MKLIMSHYVCTKQEYKRICRELGIRFDDYIFYELVAKLIAKSQAKVSELVGPLGSQCIFDEMTQAIFEHVRLYHGDHPSVYELPGSLCEKLILSDYKSDDPWFYGSESVLLLTPPDIPDSEYGGLLTLFIARMESQDILARMIGSLTGDKASNQEINRAVSGMLAEKSMLGAATHMYYVLGTYRDGKVFRHTMHPQAVAAFLPGVSKQTMQEMKVVLNDNIAVLDRLKQANIGKIDTRSIMSQIGGTSVDDKEMRKRNEHVRNVVRLAFGAGAYFKAFPAVLKPGLSNDWLSRVNEAGGRLGTRYTVRDVLPTLDRATITPHFRAGCFVKYEHARYRLAKGSIRWRKWSWVKTEEPKTAADAANIDNGEEPVVMEQIA